MNQSWLKVEPIQLVKTWSNSRCLATKFVYKHCFVGELKVKTKAGKSGKTLES